MDAYQLISPVTGKPCSVFVCGKCNIVRPNERMAELCCKPCACGKASEYNFDAKCIDCRRKESDERERQRLEKAEEIAWDEESMILCEGLGYRDGWFASPDDVLDHCADQEEEDIPEFGFASKKIVKGLDLDRALEEITEETYEDAELHVAPADLAELQAAVKKFNDNYAITYFDPDYKHKVRIRASATTGEIV